MLALSEFEPNNAKNPECTENDQGVKLTKK